jgi:hypothetical protein
MYDANPLCDFANRVRFRTLFLFDLCVKYCESIYCKLARHLDLLRKKIPYGSGNIPFACTEKEV